MARILNPDDPSNGRSNLGTSGGVDKISTGYGLRPDIGSPGMYNGPGSYGTAPGGIDLNSVVDNKISSSAPGASLNVSQPDEERMRMQALLAQLNSTAQTGNGTWQQALQNATTGANASAEALGQSQAGQNPLLALRNIGNAQAANNQQAIGQGNILRAQTQQQALQDLATIGSATNTTDAQQAAQAAAARQSLREANNDIAANNFKNTAGILGGVGQAAMAIGGASQGGSVQGKASVFGDSEANDTVPAWLSPGEIVLPRSVTQSGNAPEAAAAFVQAIQRQHNSKHQHHFAPGGRVDPNTAGDQPGSIPVDTKDASGLYGSIGHPVDANGVQTDAQGNQTLLEDPSVTAGSGWNPLSGLLPGQTQEAASTLNGGLLSNINYNQSRGQNIDTANALQRMSQGLGPSVVGQQAQNARDSNIADALRAMAGGRADQSLAGKLGSANQGVANQAGQTAQVESERGLQGYANALQNQRAQDLAFAQAQQQAQWRNTMLNSGIASAQQATLANLLSGAGQAATAGSRLFKSNSPGATSSLSDAGAANGGDLSSLGDVSGVEDVSNIEGGEGFSSGGEIEDERVKSFLAAMRKRRAA